MANDGFNGIAPFQCVFEPPGVNAPFLPGFVNRDIGDVNTAIAQIDKHFLGADATEDFGLFQTGLQGMAVVRVTWETTCPEDEVAFISDSDADLDTKFVFFMDFAFSDAFDFRGMETVELILVLPLLAENALAFP